MVTVLFPMISEAPVAPPAIHTFELLQLIGVKLYAAELVTGEEGIFARFAPSAVSMAFTSAFTAVDPA